MQTQAPQHVSPDSLSLADQQLTSLWHRDLSLNPKSLAELDSRQNHHDCMDHHDCVDRHHTGIAYQRYSSLRPEAIRLTGTMIETSKSVFTGSA